MNKKLPKEYIPFKEVWVCSNKFDSGNVIFEIDDTPVFLIGRGREASETFLWFSVPKKSGLSSKWHEVISKNKINDEMFTLNITDYGNEVTLGEQPLLQFKVIGEKLIINMIDLKPIGLNIYGGLSSLIIVGNNFINNSFSNVNTMINIGN